MTARLATVADLDECMRMGSAFAKAAGVESDVESIATTLLGLMESNGLFVVGAPAFAMAALLVYPNYFKRDQLMAQEMFWWVDPRSRNAGVGAQLLEILKDTAKARGARKLMMVALDSLDGERVAGMYMSAGFKPLERNFVRDL